MEQVTPVIPRDDFHLELEFDTGEQKLFDARLYLETGVFRRLQDLRLFKQAYVAGGTVCWPPDLDIAPETLYDRSVLLRSARDAPHALPLTPDASPPTHLTHHHCFT